MKIKEVKTITINFSEEDYNNMEKVLSMLIDLKEFLEDGHYDVLPSVSGNIIEEIDLDRTCDILYDLIHSKNFEFMNDN